MVKKDIAIEKNYPNSQGTMTRDVMCIVDMWNQDSRKSGRDKGGGEGDHCYQVAGTQSLSNTAAQGGLEAFKGNEPLLI